MGTPKISVVIVFYNMRREAKRTLFSLTTEYQKDISIQDYEVIVIDSGSSEPLDADFVKGIQENFYYRFIQPDCPSPCQAMNEGARLANANIILNIIDGARILSPGILNHVLMAFRLFDNPLVATVGMHVGKKIQNEAMLDGYNSEVEDQLLSTINWREDGYRLFEVSCLAGSSKQGYFITPSESNCFAVLKSTLEAVGGFNEKFRTRGGGLVNLDVFQKILSLEGVRLVIILGEATFHQFHGGVATNVLIQNHPWNEFAEEYRQIYLKDYQDQQYKSVFYMGEMRESIRRFLIVDIYSASNVVDTKNKRSLARRFYQFIKG